MSLTPHDVRSKHFTPVRMREGYDPAEVDAFLDDVEAELERLLAENQDLRAKLAAMNKLGDKPVAPAGAAAPVGSVGEATSSAVRLLDMATKHADDLIQEAKDTADRFIGEARANAERLENDARRAADRIIGEASARAENLDGELAERRTQMLSALEKRKGELDRTIDNLHAYEREYRNRLKIYFSEQLKALGSSDNAPDSRNDSHPEAPAQDHGA